MVNIELYCDGNYPRGLSVLYQIDGQKSIQFSYIEKCRENEIFKKDTYQLDQNEMVTQIDLWKLEDTL